ncbi:MAG TPA: sigma 54-interacting transcriptional regulator [Thermodesulfobacteriota bacterium]|nr:sigma 54-interacting transcriptional regulator [Thermodesulfobacteriota bacterium]
MDNVQAKKVRGNLLIVDDDLSARQTIEAFLDQEGYEVRCAPNGQTALMFSQEDPPELILLDIRLPDMDGFEVCRRLKKDHRTRNIPVIFVSGLDEVADKVKGFAAGGVDYVSKPFEAEEVLARVKTHLTLQGLKNQLEQRVQERTAALVSANEQLLTEIKQREQAEKVLAERLRFEELLLSISSRFVTIPPDRVDSEIDRGLRQILEYFQVDRCGLVQSLPGKTSWQITHVANSDDFPPVPTGVELPMSSNPWSYEKLILKREVVAYSRLDDLPPEANVDKQTWAESGIRSNVSIPILIGEPVVHVISIYSMKSERVWPKEFFPRLQIVGEIFVNALERKQMEQQLRVNLREIENLKQRLERENIYLQEEVRLLVEHTEIVGESLAMKKVLSQAEQVARTDSTVLIQGETGTGKELLARAIHNMSARKDRPLVTVNCASLPPTLIESELFGRERGAYTGALTKMVGRFEIADGSTLFLDEIGELPLELQSKLLRVLEEGNFERLGSTKTLHVNVRIIAATNRDIEHEVRDGRFRKDLFYRLNVFPIMIPPLRERPGDIPLMVWAFVSEFQKRMGKEIETISKKSMETLQSYSWPGNVRELRNVIEHAMILIKSKTLVVHVPKLRSSEAGATRNLEDMERGHIMAVLERVGWRVAGKGGAAEAVGLKRSTLISKMKKLGIYRPAS